MTRPAPSKARTRRRWPWVVLVIAVTIAVLGLAAVGLSQGRGLLASGGGDGDLLSYAVEPVDLRITVNEAGTLESASSVKVLSEVEGRVAIISLVPEGTRVEAGDVVVELDASALKTRHTEQQIVVEKARATASQAQQANTVAQSQAESDIKSAELALEFARLDLKKYLEGDYPQQLRTLQSEITLAEEELERARVQLEYSKRLRDDGYLSEGELDVDRFRVMRAEITLELGRAKEQMLREHTFVRTKRDLEAKVTEAERALERTRKLAAATVEQEQTSLKAAQATLALEESKLAHYAEQIDNCLMRAPQAGIVVYPVPEDDDLVELFIREGTIIRERQHVFSIPDTDQLQVKTSIHEAVVNEVEPGMPGRVWVDVFPDLELPARVKRVSPLPDPEDWRRTTVKYYETKLVLEQQRPELRPGMSCKVEILLDELNDVPAVPVQTVVQRGDLGACYVLAGGGPELRRVRLGKSNDKFIEVLEGLSPGERVVLSPDLLGVPERVLQELKHEAEAVAAAQPDEPAATTEPEKHQVEHEGLLRGDVPALAEAQYEITTQGDVVDYEFEIEVRGGPPGAVWDVAVDGVVIGAVTLDATGSVEQEWATKDGTFPEQFPQDVGPGSVVTLGGDVLSGTLGP